MLSTTRHLSRAFAVDVCAARTRAKQTLALHYNILSSPSSRPRRIQHISSTSRRTAFSTRTDHPPPPRQTETEGETSFTDPARADLFYHLLQPPEFALSFLPDPPAERDAPGVIGWLPAEGAGEAGLNDFRENPRFRDALHGAVRAGLAEGCDDIWRNGAIQVGEGWMHIHDERNPPPLGRIGDMDDIIGSVRVEEGKILAATYEPMPSYRICTADGVTTLTEGLAKKLREVLERK